MIPDVSFGIPEGSSISCVRGYYESDFINISRGQWTNHYKNGVGNGDAYWIFFKPLENGHGFDFKLGDDSVESLEVINKLKQLVSSKAPENEIREFLITLWTQNGGGKWILTLLGNIYAEGVIAGKREIQVEMRKLLGFYK